VRIGSWDDYRGTVDLNGSIGDKLAVRFNGVMQDRKSWRDFEDMHLKGAALAVAYHPFSSTTFRVDTEFDNRPQVVAFPYPVSDFLSQWLNAGRPIAATDTATTLGTASNTVNSLVYIPLSGGGLQSWDGTRQTVKGPSSVASSGLIENFTDFALIPRSVYLGGSGSNSDGWQQITTVSLDQQIGPVALQLAYNYYRTDRTVHYVVQPTSLGVFADANPTLPNGSPNPNVGQFYVESLSSILSLWSEQDSVRAIASYKLDLSAIHLGVHSITALSARQRADTNNDTVTLVNLTPPGTTTYPVNLTNSNNTIRERTYLNFGSDNLSERGALDPSQYPISSVTAYGTGGAAFPVTAGYRRIANSTNPQTAVTESAVIADQSSFWDDRLVVTLGARNDSQALYSPGGATQDPVTGLFSPQRLVGENVYSGNTRSVGGVVNPFPWIGLFYNNSLAFKAQTALDLASQPIGPSTGRTQDWGLKLHPWAGRIYLTITHYQTAQNNVQQTSDTIINSTLIPVINDIWSTLGQPAKEVATTARDSADSSGKGWEAEMIANLTPSWRLMFNASQDHVDLTNILSRYSPYIAANTPAWLQSGGVGLTSTSGLSLTNPTISNAVSSLQSAVALDQASSGEVPRLEIEYMLNAFTAYTFTSGSPWIKGITVGGGVNNRGKPVVGYDTSNPSHPFPIFGAENVLFNGLVSKQLKLKRGVLKFQMNVDNLFNNMNLLITDKDNTGTGLQTYRYQFQTPRKWSVTTTYSY